MYTPKFKNFYGCDIETTGFELDKAPKFLFGTIFGDETKYVFADPKDFWKFVAKIKENSVIAFFNMPFDFHFLISSMPAYRHVKINYLGKPSFILLKKLKKKGNVIIHFLDIGNFVGYSGGLSGIAQAFCPHIPKIEFNLEQEGLDINNKEFVEYCLRDSEICYTVIKMIFEKFGVGVSISQIAGRWLKRITEVNPKRDEEIKKIERESYFGGFVEIYKFLDIFEGVKLDVNSMFPYVMTKPLPRRFLYEMTEEEVENFVLMNDEVQAYLCYAEIESYNRDWNILPVRINGNVICPVGQFSGWYWEHLLIFAKKYGLVDNVKIKRVLVYEKTDKHIKYIREKYKQRLQAKTEAESILVKLFLNASYGKMAQLKRESISFSKKDFLEEFGEIPDYINDEEMNVEFQEKMWKVRDYGNIIQLERKTDIEAKGSFTAMSSYITSLARLEICKHIIMNKDAVMSVDTDCITIKKDAIKSWENMIGKNLGEFKIEAQGLIKLHAPKIYAVIQSNGKILSKIKGVPNSKVSKTQITKIEKDCVHFRYRHVLKPLEALKRKEKLEPYTTILTEKEIFGYSRYTKGYVMPNGKVLPLIVSQNSPIRVFVREGCLNTEYLKIFYKKYLKEME